MIARLPDPVRAGRRCSEGALTSTIWALWKRREWSDSLKARRLEHLTAASLYRICTLFEWPHAPVAPGMRYAEIPFIRMSPGHVLVTQRVGYDA